MNPRDIGIENQEQNLYIQSEVHGYLNLQHSLRELLHSLPDTQIGQYLLSATEDSIELVSTMEHLNDLTHTSLSDTATTEDVSCLLGNFLC